MRKISLCVLAILLLSIFLGGCAAQEKSSEKLTIVSSIFPSYDFARQICGDFAEIRLLIPPGNEVHGYEPTLKDIAMLEDCDLFLYAGGDADEWTQDIVKTLGREDLAVLSMTDLTGVVTEEHEHSHEHEHEHEHTAETDEHVWTSPLNVVKIVKGICAAVCELDPAHTEQYRENTEGYIGELQLLDADFQQLAEKNSGKTLIFAERFPFRHFAEEYGFQYAAALNGCSSETEPSLAVISELINRIKEENLGAFFYIEFSDGRIAEVIAEETGAQPMLLHSCQNVTKEEFRRGATYLELMRENLNTLEEALHA